MEESKQKRYNKLYMDLAERIAKMSYAKRLQVGSVLVKNDSIISYGWNGTPSGFDNLCEEIIEYHEDGGVVTITKSEVLHSEMNCLAKVARSTNSAEGADMFITHSPCMECAKLIYQAGIKSIYYRTIYRDDTGLKFLNKCNVPTIKIE